MHVRDLNFVFWSEIFKHFDGQLWASHLILGCNPIYSTWQPFGQALLVDSPLLSYIDVRHPNLFPPNLTVGEAQDFGPLMARAESLIPVRDALVDIVSQSRTVHRPIEEPQVQVQPIKQVASKSVNSSEAEANQGEGKMVVKRTMTLDRFLLGACPVAQQQQP